MLDQDLDLVSLRRLVVTLSYADFFMVQTKEGRPLVATRVAPTPINHPIVGGLDRA